jgi:hypothetical protein
MDNLPEQRHTFKRPGFLSVRAGAPAGLHSFCCGPRQLAECYVEGYGLSQKEGGRDCEMGGGAPKMPLGRGSEAEVVDGMVRVELERIAVAYIRYALPESATCLAAVITLSSAAHLLDSTIIICIPSPRDHVLMAQAPAWASLAALGPLVDRPRRPSR